MYLHNGSDRNGHRALSSAYEHCVHVRLCVRVWGVISNFPAELMGCDGDRSFIPLDPKLPKYTQTVQLLSFWDFFLHLLINRTHTYLNTCLSRTPALTQDFFFFLWQPTQFKTLCPLFSILFHYVITVIQIFIERIESALGGMSTQLIPQSRMTSAHCFNFSLSNLW